MLTFTRPLLDWCIQQRLARNPRIRILGRCRVTDLAAGPGRGAVTGVRCVSLKEAQGAAPRERVLHADLIVDASVRFGRAPEWLAALGYKRPAEMVIDAALGYGTRPCEPPLAFRSDWKALLIMGKPPQATRGGVLLPVESQRWLVTLAGRGEDRLPTDVAGFLAFAHGAISPALCEAIGDARPLAPIVGC